MGPSVPNCRRPTNDNTTKPPKRTWNKSKRLLAMDVGIEGQLQEDCPERKNRIWIGCRSTKRSLYVPRRLFASLGETKSLIIHGDGSHQGNVTRLNIISCTKMQKYMEKGFPIFLAHITAKEVEDKSEKKRLEDVPIVQDFPEVFPEDLPGLPPTRQVEFQIDLVPSAAPVARAPYRLWQPSEIKEFL
ncbi:hypothetical protein Tco_0478985 [Tanacetum coccineum]